MMFVIIMSGPSGTCFVSGPNAQTQLVMTLGLHDAIFWSVCTKLIWQQLIQAQLEYFSAIASVLMRPVLLPGPIF